MNEREPSRRPEAGSDTSMAVYIWSLFHAAPDRCVVCGEEESASPAWAGTHKYGPAAHGPFESSKEGGNR